MGYDYLEYKSNLHSIFIPLISDQDYSPPPTAYDVFELVRRKPK